MAGFTFVYAQNKILDAVYGATSFVAPNPLFLALFTVAPSPSGSGGTEVSGGSYSRLSVVNNSTTFPNAIGGSKSNNITFTFPTATANWGLIVGAGWYDAISAGNGYYYGALSVPFNINSGQTFVFSAADMTGTES